jgi:hypothetical protein
MKFWQTTPLFDFAREYTRTCGFLVDATPTQRFRSVFQLPLVVDQGSVSLESFLWKPHLTTRYPGGNQMNANDAVQKALSFTYRRFLTDFLPGFAFLLTVAVRILFEYPNSQLPQRFVGLADWMKAALVGLLSVPLSISAS